MKKVYLLLLASLMMFIFVACDQPTDPIEELEEEEVVVDPVPVETVTSDDGFFTLTNSTVAFNSETSVSLFDLGLGAQFETSNFYAPINLDRLENGTTDPVISFTFDEALYNSTMEGVFSITDPGLNPSATTSDAKDNVFYNMSTGPIEATAVTISDATVSFTFEAGTFAADDLITVVFAVKKATGEVYQVFTAFQPLADVTSAPVITADFSDYYAYAVDSDRIFFLNLTDPGTHIIAPTPAENLYNVTPAAGIDFGNLINTVSKRYTNTLGTADFFHLDGMDPTNITSIYPLTHTLATHATSYVYVIEDIDGNSSVLVNGSDYDTFSVLNDDAELIGYDLDLYIDQANTTIEAGDTLYVIPVNSRGEFENYAASYVFADTVSPFGNSGNIDLASGDAMTWAGENWGNHDQTMADDEGEVRAFTTFDLTSLTNWGVNEAIDVTLNSTTSLTAALDTGTLPTGGATRVIASEDEILAQYPGAAGSVFQSFNGGRIWVSLAGTVVTAYVGFECNDGTDGIDYTGTTWHITGDLDFTITDMSGNPLMYTDSTATEHNENLLGALSVTL
ncbi:MAG: hypothetical protein JEY91_11645 [Spirochaetaceae bacterium]|nr:hypothetical protein [Spirochaetaceae bacterium]